MSRFMRGLLLPALDDAGDSGTFGASKPPAAHKLLVEPPVGFKERWSKSRMPAVGFRSLGLIKEGCLRPIKLELPRDHPSDWVLSAAKSFEVWPPQPVIESRLPTKPPVLLPAQLGVLLRLALGESVGFESFK